MIAFALPALLIWLLVLPSAALGAGELDPSFGGDGKVVTDFGPNDLANDVAIQADGKIVAAGLDNSSTGDGDFALARYNPGGSLDPSFDGDGRVLTDFGGGDRAYGVAIQTDGKIVAAGSGGASRSSPTARSSRRALGIAGAWSITSRSSATTRTGASTPLSDPTAW
jgi:uncharacterized delta-60 repeat protein